MLMMNLLSILIGAQYLDSSNAHVFYCILSPFLGSKPLVMYSFHLQMGENLKAKVLKALCRSKWLILIRNAWFKLTKSLHKHNLWFEAIDI